MIGLIAAWQLKKIMEKTNLGLLGLSSDDEGNDRIHAANTGDEDEDDSRCWGAEEDEGGGKLGGDDGAVDDDRTGDLAADVPPPPPPPNDNESVMLAAPTMNAQRAALHNPPPPTDNEEGVMPTAPTMNARAALQKAGSMIKVSETKKSSNKNRSAPLLWVLLLSSLSRVEHHCQMLEQMPP